MAVKSGLQGTAVVRTPRLLFSDKEMVFQVNIGLDVEPHHRDRPRGSGIIIVRFGDIEI